MEKLDLSGLDDLFAQGKDFELTDAQYEELVKRPLPKDSSYVKHYSPLACRAKEKGLCDQSRDRPSPDPANGHFQEGEIAETTGAQIRSGRFLYTKSYFPRSMRPAFNMAITATPVLSCRP